MEMPSLVPIVAVSPLQCVYRATQRADAFLPADTAVMCGEQGVFLVSPARRLPHRLLHRSGLLQQRSHSPSPLLELRIRTDSGARTRLRDLLQVLDVKAEGITELLTPGGLPFQLISDLV
ncbi:hypothetical protein EHS25_009207 [Saitozyma podzolica]|uniref:Uncharacterized protein n=1 Tax=Saitozyma podzolica TaxID=1890683 RepID=A0A427YLA9_9TREE|nr:hypothetical protein EHS25_009207 [Saitozyma podzolica]